MTAAGGSLLQVIGCAADPASDLGQLVTLGQDRGWVVQVIATPSALPFVDVPGLEAQTGRPVRSSFRRPDEPKPPRADAIIVAPATFNTINKFAQGISDTYALSVLAEAPGLRIPVVIVPFVNAALAARPVFADSLARLRAEGVRILAGPGESADFPWILALDALGQ